MGSSVFWMLRSFGVGVEAAYAGQGVISAIAVLGCWVMWRRPAAEPVRRLAMTVFLTLLASPYGFTDDLSVYSVMLAVLARRETPWRNAALAVLWVAPAFVSKFVAIFGFLPTPLLLMSAVALAWRHGSGARVLRLAEQKQPLLAEPIG